MKNTILFFLLLACFSSFAQFNKKKSSKPIKAKPITFNVDEQPKLELKFPTIEKVNTITSNQLNFNINSTFNLYPMLPSGDGYWAGNTSTHFNQDGTLKATYTYDMLGNVRESQLSFSFKKKD